MRCSPATLDLRNPFAGSCWTSSSIALPASLCKLAEPVPARAEQLYARVLNDYGDDSVAQLGGVHVACEGASNVLTKVLEWGRLMAYLEQSTRYVPYTDRPDGRWKYHLPAEIEDETLRRRYEVVLDEAFSTYARWIDPLQAFCRERFPKAAADSDAAYRAAIRSKSLDLLRGLLPAATQSNVGIYGTGQAYENLLLRMRASPLAEVRRCADAMLIELRRVIPAFLVRIDRSDRGGRSSQYLADTRTATASVARQLMAGLEPEAEPEVVLTDFDPEGEVKVVAAALYASSDLPDDQLLRVARRMFSPRPCRGTASLRRRAIESAAQARPRVRADLLPVRHPG